MMKRTMKHMKDLQDAMNTNEVIQAQMAVLAARAEKLNVTPEQWEEFKVRLMATMYYKMAEMIPVFKADLGKDIYEELRAQ